MKLYHFTNSKNLDSIMAEGLKPSKEGVNCAPDLVLWLTRATTPDWIILDPRHLDCRLKLFIPSGDPKLQKWEHYLCKYEPRLYGALLNDPKFQKHTFDTTWIYFGTLPPMSVREILTGITYNLRVVDDDGRDVGDYDEYVEESKKENAL
jgi:hypothetical protein